MIKNNERWTPRDMLYFDDQIVGNQVKIKLALEEIQIKWDNSGSPVFQSKRQAKDVIFNERAKLLMDEMHAQMIKDLKSYRSTHAVSQWYADAIAGNAIAKAALEIEADTLNEAEETILHVESKKGDKENVRFIVNEFANKNILVKGDRLKQTALHLAAYYGHTQVVEVLVDAARYTLSSSLVNDDIHNPISSFQDFIRQATGPMGNTALHLAVLDDNVAIVKLLVEADPNDSHVQDIEGKTPIYIAAEKGYKDIVKEISKTCTALSLDGPGGRTTALHALIQNIDQEGASDVLRMMVDAARRWNTAEDASLINFEALFRRSDESGRTVLQLAVERNHVDAVKLILLEDPAYQHDREIKRNGLIHLIDKSMNKKGAGKEYSNDIINLLSETYKAGIDHDHKDVLALILAIKRRDEDVVLRLLGYSKNLVSFTEDNGWTPLQYAVFHEFDSVLCDIIEAQKEVGYHFGYEPFHVAVEYGYTSTLVRLMQLWSGSSFASIASNSPYTAVNQDGRNILHLAADHDHNRKEMVQGILKYCPEKYMEKILKQQDINGDTPHHLLISHGCYIPELMKHEGVLDYIKAKNKNKYTPWDMLYFKNDVISDQVHIKIALEDVQSSDQPAWNLWAKRKQNKMDISKSIVPPSKKHIKDMIFDECKKLMTDAKHEQMKKDLEKYRSRTNTQIIVIALITTVTFMVGFTMSGGLHQSGEVDEGLVMLSKKKAFNAFIVSDALALLLSTSSLFFYFLGSMNDDPREVSKLNAASIVLNIISVVAMMMTFIAGTYVVLSHSPVIAMTVCVIGSLFFFLIIFLLIKMVYYRLVNKNIEA